MKIIDCIYEEVVVEDILEKIINTKAVQRLKHIHQGGASYLINPKWNVTRYEHSVGTMIFVKLMGGSIEEQIAALLHDISHTAFSHVVDFALDNKEEDYHEKIYNEIVNNSEIPKILKENGYDYKDILFDESKWTILEKSAPKLCGDRIDYTLRDMYNNGVITKEEINEFLDSLVVVEGEVVINKIQVAEWFVDVYYKEVIDFFTCNENAYAYDRLSKALKIGLKEKYISLEDLLKDDDCVLELLKESRCKEIIDLIESINEDVKFIEDKENYDIFQKQKVRTIDPSVLIDGKIYKASEKSNLVKKLNEDINNKHKEGIFIRVLKN